jgi:hypothetical protein
MNNRYARVFRALCAQAFFSDLSAWFVGGTERHSRFDAQASAKQQIQASAALHR